MHLCEKVSDIDVNQSLSVLLFTVHYFNYTMGREIEICTSFMNGFKCTKVLSWMEEGEINQ